MKVPTGLTKEEQNYIVRSDYIVRFKKLFSFLLSTAGKEQQYSLLELGCRTGMLIKFLEANGLSNIKCYGVDIEPNFLKNAALLGMTVKECDLNWEKIPFDNDKFDYIVSFELLEHIPFYHKHLSEIKRILRNNGKLLLTTPNIAKLGNRFSFLMGVDIHRVYSLNQKDVHYRMFTMNSIIKLFMLHGFNIAKKSYLISTKSKGIFLPLKHIIPSCGDIIFCVGVKK